MSLAGFFLEPVMVALPQGLLRGLAWAYPAMACVAAAIAAQSSHARRAPLFAGLAAAGVTVAVLLSRLQERP